MCTALDLLDVSTLNESELMQAVRLGVPGSFHEYTARATGLPIRLACSSRSEVQASAEEPTAEPRWAWTPSCQNYTSPFCVPPGAQIQHQNARRNLTRRAS